MTRMVRAGTHGMHSALVDCATADVRVDDVINDGVGWSPKLTSVSPDKRLRVTGVKKSSGVERLMPFPLWVMLGCPFLLGFPRSFFDSSCRGL